MNEIKTKKFIFVLNPKGPSAYLCSDLYSDKRVVILNSFLRDLHNPLLKGLRKIHLSKKINSRINLPFKNIWKCSLRDIEWNYNTKYYVILLGSSLRQIDYSYLLRIREKYDVKYILLMIDLWDSNNYSLSARYYKDKLKFDYIFSFDLADCKKHNFIYTNVPYSKLCDDTPYKKESDIYLAASVTTRGGVKVFHDIYKHLKDNEVCVDYRLVDVPSKEQIFKEKIIYNKRIPYMQVIEGLMKSNCILEVLATGQSGATFRYYEAVCYNKKLLTTNKNVVNLPFYNPKYIHVFEKPEDIDCNWVKERIPVDYGYDGRFSPSRLIDKIIELEEEKEG